ncbi:twin transmembrane helix small protein [Oryzomicrobium sp.]|uniref:twin transmembrane helix small protein n=1 Tax=Oryzomicrobium sp. TaxID=1911578 RepID=UPI0025DD208D|nr:twin transmembrane helix small protein [Oryzomicrobium sp.]MCE1243749.1 twin transmembrane helix small protein [Oryzomicrobium sp.]
MVFKLVVIAVLLAIVASLFSGLVFLYRDRGQGTRAVRALTVRIGLSIMLFLLLLVAFRLGWLPAVR